MVVFDYVSSFPFAVMVIFVSSKAYVRPRMSDDVVMHVVVKGGVFEFIGCGQMNNGIVVCELRQDWFEFFAMYKTRMPHINDIKKVRWEGIEMCDIFGGTILFSRASRSFWGWKVVSHEK